ncbi:MAG TPA: HlyD family efflux transporter periplasmic adaptor subunit [Nitrospirae bacterium]|nr:HlyD family efflux transporter periplasmic adaptor subunit [Nitrospirota bacterium]
MIAAIMRSVKVAIAISLIVAASACNKDSQNVYQGYIEGDYLYISSSVGGNVEKILAGKGDRVDTGALLFELDAEPERASYQEAKSLFHSAKARYEDITKGQRPTELAAIEESIGEAKAALTFSKKELERAETLYKKELISEEKMDAAKLAYDRDRARFAELSAKLKTAKLGAREDRIKAAKSDVERSKAVFDKAEWRLSQMKGAAPASALVVDVLYFAGEFVPAGYPVVVLLPPDKVKARFFVPETKLSTIKTGQKITMTIDGLNGAIEGTISYIAHEAEYTPPFIYSKDNREKLVFMVEASFDPGDSENLNPGQPVEIRL